ncbi:hypothetical protein [Chryseobacterium sp. Leaf394]|uniref:hypothetical protein n=1 Tax=Chryseobacterium sp. Leaf394 TaxID=1736361 RepID=UPI0006F31C49|nr:hypothetical protein [Chryseobacterium sp. Leaf394]KQS92203.1 hypothetical protein ASG21_07080 [Chryseobacterium sp. Leaf394]
MVNKTVLYKLSNRELENYFNPENRFVHEAVQLAFDILQERGRIFSDAEKINIQHLIQSKKENEAAEKREEAEDWKDHITTDQNAIQLFPREIILIISIFLGTIPGCILLGLNFIKLKKIGASILTFFFGFAFFHLQNFLVPFMYENSSKRFYTLKNSPEFFVSCLGALTIFLFWISFTPKNLPYRKESYLIPAAISFVMIALVLINPDEWFSNYFITSFLRDYNTLF